MKASRVLLDLLQEEEASLRESSFHMTRRGDEDTEGRGGGLAPKMTPERGTSGKIVGLGEGLLKD